MLRLDQESQTHKSSNLWHACVEAWRVFRSAPTGRRFRTIRAFQRKHGLAHNGWSRTLLFAVGLALIVVGVSIGWLPGPGGFLAILGLLLVAREIPGVAAALDYCEIRGARLWRWYRALPRPAQITLFAIAISLAPLAVLFTLYLRWNG